MQVLLHHACQSPQLFTSDFTISFSFMNAAGVVAVVPPVILAATCERYLVAGLTAGAVKG